MKTKVVRDYKVLVDCEYSLLGKVTKINRIGGLEAIGLFMTLEAKHNQIIDIYRLSSDTKQKIDSTLKKLCQVGLIKIADTIENNENIRVIYLQNPYKVL